MNKVMVIAAHPDDEALGCGGTMARHASDGDEVKVVFVADGETARVGAPPDLRRREPAQKACNILGAKEVVFLDLPDQKLDSMPLLDIVQRIEPLLEAGKPDIIYTHHGGDLNSDHRIVHHAVMTALRPMPGSTYKAIYAFEVPSATEWATPAIGQPFVPNHFVNITGFLGKKFGSLKIYEAEMREYPHARSKRGMEDLNSWRGVTVGVNYAEAFMTLRTIVR